MRRPLIGRRGVESPGLTLGLTLDQQLDQPRQPVDFLALRRQNI